MRKTVAALVILCSCLLFSHVGPKLWANPMPTRLRIEKRGNFVYLFLGDGDREMRFSGASIQVPLQGTYYVGIGVCSHDKDVVEKAVFANVDLAEGLAPVAKTTLYSTLEKVA